MVWNLIGVISIIASVYLEVTSYPTHIWELYQWYVWLPLAIIDVIFIISKLGHHSEGLADAFDIID